jgi:hypothetical protein
VSNGLSLGLSYFFLYQKNKNQLVSQIKQLSLSFQTAKKLCLGAEMLPSGPRWKSHVLHTQVVMKCKAIVFYRDPIECLQALLSHPLFASHVSFVLQKVWSLSAQIVCVYNE